MATRTALLNGNVINRDSDFSKHIEAVSEPWVISWFTVTASSVAVWEAFVKCERTNWDVIYALVYNASAQSISWDWDVYIEVSQEIIDNWELWNEDWTGIATIQVWIMPSKNALKLATISSGTVTDKRNMIKRVGELKTLIDTNIEDIADLDERVEALEEAGAIDHLEESALVGELYSLNDNLFKQYTPILVDSTANCNVSDTNDNKQIHIQRIGSWVATNQLKLKVKMVWSSTQNLIVEVRKWVQVTVTADNEAYWYWDQVIASWSISYSDISTSYAEKTITLDDDFWWTEWELLDVVVYMNTVNSSNYYCIACDSTQSSEWLSYVAVNWSTRVRSKITPYCPSDWFTSTILAKRKDESDYTAIDIDDTTVWTIWASTVGVGNNKVSKTAYRTATTSWVFSASFIVSGSSGFFDFYIYVNWETVVHQSLNKGDSNVTVNTSFTCFTWDVVSFTMTASSNSTYADVAQNTNIVQTTKYVFVPQNAIRIIPQEMKNLWELWMWTLYWKNPSDWVFYGWIMLDKDTVATTWDIAPWNFVWYIKVNLNWEIVKIPYYS